MFSLIESDKKEEVLIYRTPEKRHLSQFVDKISEVFSRDEPICKALQLKPEILSQYIFKETIEQGDISLSAIAENVKTNELFGGYLVSDFTNFVENPKESKQNAQVSDENEPKNVTILKEFLGQLEAQYLQNHEYPQKNEVAYCYAGFLERNYRSLGIAYKFFADQEEYYNKLGYKKIVSIFTGHRSQALGMLHGYKLIASASYKGYQYERVNVFKDVRDDYCVLMEKDISDVHTRLHKVKRNVKFTIANIMFKVVKFFKSSNRNKDNQQVLQKKIPNVPMA